MISLQNIHVADVVCGRGISLAYGLMMSAMGV